MSYPEQDRRQQSDSNAYFNAQFSAKPVIVLPGEAGWSQGSDEMLVASVGEGVVVTFHDPELKMAAMGYVVMPDDVEQAFPYFKDFERSHIAKALEPLDNAIGLMKRHGAGKSRLSIRLYGAAAYQSVPEHRGLKHLVFVREYLSRKGLALLNEDIGGSAVRRVHFLSDSGRSVSMLLRRQEDFAQLAEQEKRFRAQYKQHCL